MLVRDLMKPPQVCGPADSLERAAQLLWEHDCGVAPVVDEHGRLVGMLTDRDICMAAYTQGCALAALPVHLAMARAVVRCRPTLDVEAALRIMAEAQIHRLPVVDENERLIGILSISDVLQGLQAQPPAARNRVSVLLADALAAIRGPREGERLQTAQPAPPAPRRAADQRAKAASK